MPPARKSFFDLFQNPTREYRGKPFWSWNGKLEPEELRRQLHIIKKMGMGGAFLHSRVGLATPYLGREWFDCIRASIDECRELGLEAWLYDEDRWPSGSAGGLVTRDPRYRLHFLAMEVRPRELFEGHRGLLGAWQGVIGTQDRIMNLKPIPEGASPSKGKDIRVLCLKDIPMPESSWYNGYTYLDVLSPAAVDRFIEVTHEAYRKEVGSEFGKSVFGIFTDEPNYGFVWPFTFDLPEGVQMAVNPWTPGLLNIFRKEYGYDLRPHLPELFLEVEGIAFSTARYHYRRLVTKLFVESFSKRIGEWCQRNRIALTGHVLLEGNMRNTTMVVGSTMPFYEHMQVPGIDVLTEHSYEYDTAKQTVSVANQMGRKWVLTELYGCTGWDFSLEGHKAVGDWQTALGINLRCHHLSWYTMKGEAKRDYPASIFFQSPWWEHYGVVEDYYSRVHVALAEGDAVRRILVIHPIESMWARFRPPRIGDVAVHEILGEKNQDVRELDEMLPALRNWLLEEHLDFDYGDESLLARHGKVRLRDGQPLLQLAQADYDAVLVPPLDTIRSSTLKILQKFSESGGQVVFAGPLPSVVDGIPSQAATAAEARCQQIPFEQKSVVSALAEKNRTVSLANPEGLEIPSLLYMQRRSDERQVLFICNTDRKQGQDPVQVRIKGKGHVVELNPLDGSRFRVESAFASGWTSFVTDLPPTGSRLFTLEKTRERGLPERTRRKEIRRIPLGSPTGTQLSEHNVLALDRPHYRFGSGKWLKAVEVLKLDRLVRDTLGAPYRGGAMLQPWARPVQKNPPRVDLSLRFDIMVESLPVTPVYLALENAERYSIAFNGAPISTVEQGDGWWVDPCLRKLRIDPAEFRPGRNELQLRIEFSPEDELEALYLLGAFGVRVEGTQCALIDSPVSIGLGDWGAQGLPFYGGAVTYRFKTSHYKQRGERTFVQSGEFKGSLIRVLVNGKQAGYMPWPPYEQDITDWLVDGDNEICLQLFGSRRNMLGPLHQKNSDPQAVGPENFQTSGKDWSEGYVFKPCGLFSSPALSIRR